MLKFNKKSSAWQILFILTSLFVYLCLYSNVFDGLRAIRGNFVYTVVKRDLSSLLHHQFRSVSYYLQLLEQMGTQPEVLALNGTTAVAFNVPTTTPLATTPIILENVDNTLLDMLKVRILSNSTLPLLTLFSSWNANPKKNLVHNLTLINWRSLHPYVIPVVFSNESSIINECNQASVITLPLSAVAAGGIPVLKYMYRDVMNLFNTSFYAFSNGDILFTKELIHTLAQMIKSTTEDMRKPILIVGRRTNVEHITIDEGSDWGNITRISKSKGKLFTHVAEDYFITTQTYPWNDVPEVVIGRRAYDNWLVYNSRKMKYNVIDATNTILAVHQTTQAGNFEGHGHSNRDYNHNLLTKMYKNIKYYAGGLACVERFTQYKSKLFQIKTRKVHPTCGV
ncbi:uncharacterized protein LOC127855562 [Dreissena polymorpha]|uniref:Uncharacterized protein n=1 Tax=Dreissena polymorpha TaxID=45954 RepID=A0A9D4CDR9_DREPO|nr:uncharacterized protein LOC127855562 [Dreissena polymorpha]KAH3721824.1 hypothetical protein DPMN_064772 [Dreissena polymorpha]